MIRLMNYMNDNRVWSSCLEQQTLWSWVWSLWVPNKVKMCVEGLYDHFTYYVYPMQEEGVGVAWFPLCNDGYEDVSYSLWRCLQLRRFGKTLFVSVRFIKI